MRHIKKIFQRLFGERERGLKKIKSVSERVILNEKERKRKKEF